MKLAAKVLTASAKKIYENPEIIVDAKQELASRVGEDFKYEALLGDRDPPLDYRVN
jgi:aminobenzoyl-glutamate utilization protein B